MKPLRSRAGAVRLLTCEQSRRNTHTHTHANRHTHLHVCKCSGDYRARTSLSVRFCLRYNHKSSPANKTCGFEYEHTQSCVFPSHASVFRLCQLLFIKAKQRLACVASRPTYSNRCLDSTASFPGRQIPPFCHASHPNGEGSLGRLT